MGHDWQCCLQRGWSLEQLRERVNCKRQTATRVTVPEVPQQSRITIIHTQLHAHTGVAHHAHITHHACHYPCSTLTRSSTRHQRTLRVAPVWALNSHTRNDMHAHHKVGAPHTASRRQTFSTIASQQAATLAPASRTPCVVCSNSLS